MKHLRILVLALCLTGVTGFAAMAPSTAIAAPAPGSVNTTNEECTSFGVRATETFTNTGVSPNTGLLSEIYAFIKKTIGDATQKLFRAFAESPTYQFAVNGAITLMILFYAAGFMIGVVQPSFQQVLIRLVKIGLIGALISPTGWDFFNDNVVHFFQDGSDELIKGVEAIGFGITAPADATPFYALDRIAGYLIQPDTIIAIIGAMGAGGPFGLAMGSLLTLAMFGFFKLILKTLEVYAVTFVARSLVLGVAPIFFVFLLFDRTKNMFIAWVNALLNLSLQPILLFTFLSFFLVLIETSAQDMLGAELCWHEFKNVESGITKASWWRFKDPVTAQVNSSEYTWKGSLECLLTPGAGDANKCPNFPLNVVDILSFLILVYLASKFADVTKNIASELSNALVNIDNQGKLEQLMQQGNQSAGNAISSQPKKVAGQPPKSKGR